MEDQPQEGEKESQEAASGGALLPGSQPEEVNALPERDWRTFDCLCQRAERGEMLSTAALN
jgi:hypothetical protein